VKVRPWSLLILAWLHFLGPIGNILLSSLIQHVSPFKYFSALVASESLLGLVEDFALIPLAGWAIYSCRKWSYPVFLGVAAVTVFSNVRQWSQSPEIFPVSLLFVTVVLDAILVGYFLIPEVRRTYFDPKVRWWDNQTRYAVRFAVGVDYEEAGTPKHFTGKVHDLSEGGVFVSIDAEVPVSATVCLFFKEEVPPITVSGTIVYRRNSGVAGYGIKFLHTPESAKIFRLWVKRLEKAKTAKTMQVDLKNDFQRWVIRLVTTGKGLVPELEQNVAAKRNNPSN